MIHKKAYVGFLIVLLPVMFSWLSGRSALAQETGSKVVDIGKIYGVPVD